MSNSPTPGSQSVVNSPGVLRPMLWLVGPVLVEQLLLMMVGFADTWLTARHLETHHIAAIGMMNYILWGLSSVAELIGVGSTALVARFVGAEDMSLARRVTNQSVLLAVAISALLVMAVLFGADFFLSMIQLDAESALLARRYLSIITPFLPFLVFEVVAIACLRGAGDMVSGLVAMGLLNVVNISVGAGLLLGLGPFPKLGWDGLAIGTAAGYVTSGLLALLMLWCKRGGLSLEWRLLRWDGSLVGRILRIGIPGGMDQILVVGCHLAYVTVITSLGDVATAAHGVAVRIESLSYLPGYAFHLAVLTMVGQSLGAGAIGRAQKSVAWGCLLASVTMLLSALTFYFGAHWWAHLFLPPERADVISLTVPLLRIMAWASPPMGLAVIMLGALRGAGDTRWPLAINIAGLLGLRLPLAWLLAHTWGYGVQGAYVAMVVDMAIRCALVTARYFHGGWKRIKV